MKVFRLRKIYWINYKNFSLIYQIRLNVFSYKSLLLLFKSLDFIIKFSSLLVSIF